MVILLVGHSRSTAPVDPRVKLGDDNGGRRALYQLSYPSLVLVVMLGPIVGTNGRASTLSESSMTTGSVTT